jgi:uncharacterized membrane protein YqgA involved in biofilm formation
VPREDAADPNVVNQLTVGKSALDSVTDVSLIAALGFTAMRSSMLGLLMLKDIQIAWEMLFHCRYSSWISNVEEVKGIVTDPRFHPNNSGYGALYFP